MDSKFKRYSKLNFLNKIFTGSASLKFGIFPSSSINLDYIALLPWIWNSTVSIIKVYMKFFR